MIEQKLLLLGPKPNRKNPHRVSGTIVLFKELTDFLTESKINFNIIDTNKKNYGSKPIAFLTICKEIITKINKYSHVSIHSSQDYFIYAPIVILFKRFNTNFSLRKFGGELREVLNETNLVKRSIIKWIINNTDILFVETKYLVNFIQKYKKEVFWFPNSRKRIYTTIPKRKFNKRFVFISHVLKTKGIDEILEVAHKIDSSYTIHIYGPLINNDYTIKDLNKSGIYKGALKPDEVISTLLKYDVLLLPSYKEGYPGILIEAYSVGIPVIATELESICEILTNYFQGIVIKPRNSDALNNAIKEFTEENYSDFSLNSYYSFEDFDSSKLGNKFLEIVFNKL